ncbi:sulfite exporter TauE/SafE family protein [Paraburkholderia sp. SARCC-3016]|uniref:sulfite exporter TauE/SafE family protein n=1 Tax=Paraburkholderia sp. SARCC-3016 TaxID=3058611 RepID=UPI002809421E|nr:sulfite exporter TauE/SafE family protein [Paraburkholderia sp. SARCC-3016]MDQ7979271.1 sulfite exporter TauE/SafE family protein [Paraburkholderia sp. SARCC-3016]
MSLTTTLWLFFAGLGSSALGGMLGMASGLFIVPMLVVLFHFDLHVAVGASIVSVIACSCGGAADFLRHGLTNVRLALVLETGTTLGALTGVLVAGLIPVVALDFLFAIVLLVSAWQMYLRRTDPVAGATPVSRGSLAAALDLHSSYRDPRLNRDVAYEVRRVPAGLSLMYVAGLVSALLGIGSGILKIPAMDHALRLPIKVSTATSNFMIGVTAAASAGAYFLRGEIVSAIAGPVALGSVIGAVIGARVLMKVSNEKLRLLFLTVLVLVACAMLLQGFGIDLTARVER